VDGERFQIEVVLHPLFGFHGAPEVKILCEIDGGAALIGDFMERPTGWKNSSTALRTSFDLYPSTVAGLAKTCGFGFSKLILSISPLCAVYQPTLTTIQRTTVIFCRRKKKNWKSTNAAR
jgi:hypothetical protein